MARNFHQFLRCNFYSLLRFQSPNFIAFSPQKRRYGLQSQFVLPGNIPTKLFKVGSYNINVVQVGHGPQAVFCLPGLLGSMEVQLMEQINGFDRNKFTLYAWDQVGYGKSTPPEREINVDTLEEDSELLASLLKELGHEKYNIAGWSGGGLAALLTAINHPQLVENLVVWGAFGKVEPKDVETFKRFQNTDSWGGKMKDTLVDYYGLEFFEKHWKLWMEVLMQMGTHNGGEFVSKKLHHIKCPTLIIHGDQDALIHPNHANFLHENITDSTLHIWKRGKHNVHLRYPEEFNEIVQQFLLRSNSNSAGV